MQQDKPNSILLNNNKLNNHSNGINNQHAIQNITFKKNTLKHNSSLPLSHKLSILQNYFKQQSLMAQKQQGQKRKLVQMIQQAIQKYYAQYAHSNHQGKVTNDQQLGNCYNFVKQICLSIARDPLVGFKLLSSTQLKKYHQMMIIVVNLIYQNIAQPDFYKKPVNRMLRMLINHIALTTKQQIQQQTKTKKINTDLLTQIVSIFCKRTQIQQYFNTLANNTITAIMKINFKKQVMQSHRKGFANSVINGSYLERYSQSSQQGSNLSFSTQQYDSFSFGDGNSSAFTITQFKTQIFKKYQQQILDQATSAPIQLKIIIKILYQGLKQIFFDQVQLKRTIWSLIQNSFIQPFIIMGNYLQLKLFDLTKKQILDQIIQKLKKHARTSSNFIQNLINKLISVNQQKFDKFIVQPNLQDVQAHITIHSICLNYQEIYLIFTFIKKNQSIFQQICPKMINRLKKLYQMSENLQILKKDDKELNIVSTNTYLLFTQLHYSDLLTADYLKSYVKEYEGSIVKNILRQVLVELNSFEINLRQNILQENLTIQQSSLFQTSQNNDIQLWQIFENKMKELQKFSSGKLYISLFTKLKYLIHSLKNNEINQDLIIQGMINQVQQRLQQNLQIYQKSKFHLLKTFSNIKNRNSSLKNIRRNQKKLNSYLKNVQMIEKTQISLCISSPSTRSQLFTNQTLSKYRMSSANKILIQDPQNCVHRSNIIVGMPFHISNARQFVTVFSKLKQVRNAIQNNNDNSGIKKIIFQFIDLFKKKVIQDFKLAQLQIAQLTKVLTQTIMKTLHIYLIEKNINKHDSQFEKKLASLSFVKSKWLNVPIQNNLEQLWQICIRYFTNIGNHKTPQSKMESLKEVIQIIKIALFHNRNRQNVNSYIQTMLIYIMIRAKPKKIISNLNFIELFLSQSKLLSSDGEILNQYRKVIKKISQQKFDKIFNNENIKPQDFQNTLEQHKIIQDVNEAKANLKDV